MVSLQEQIDQINDLLMFNLTGRKEVWYAILETLEDLKESNENR